jgi:phosphatidate cytidylyltransferase
VVGLSLAAVFLLTLLLYRPGFLAFVSLILVIALLELDHAFRALGLRPATPVAVVAGVVAFVGAYLIGSDGQVLGLVVAVSGGCVWTMLDPQRDKVVASLGATLLMVAWIPFLASFLSLLLLRDDGPAYVIMVVGLTVANDVGAYAFGSRLGRHKLAPAVSPGKTWEGLIGGWVTVLVIAASVIVPFVPGVRVTVALVLGSAITVVATVGDLAESLVKRDLGVKDLGRILPGHGGVMDRIDALAFTIPAAHFILQGFGV